MRAMRAERPGPADSSPLRPVELPMPVPQRGQIRVRVGWCGVCLTDLHVVEADLPWRGPVVPGHQVVGTVDACGPAASRFGEGDAVGVAWLWSTCGSCAHCAAGRENLCEQARFCGYDVHGGYAEFLVVPEEFAYALPPEARGPDAPPLLCSGIIGYRALKLCGVRPGGRLGIFGFGASAHVTIQVAVHRGCQVYVFSRGQSHRRLAEELGAVWTGLAEETPPAKLDAAIVFAPSGPVVREALRLLDRGGTVTVAGIHLSPIPELDYRAHLYYERCVRSVANNTREDGRELLALAAEIPIKTRTRVFPLEAANEALSAVKHSRIDGAAVLEMASA